MPLVFMFAKNEEDLQKNDQAIQTTLTEQQREIVVVDISSQPLTDREYKNFIECRTKAEYLLKIDQNQAKLNITKA